MLAIFILTGIVAAISLYDYFSTRSWQAITSPVRNNAVFEKRNQNYGAYRIRRDYNRNFILILVGMVGGVGVIYGAVNTFREPVKKTAYTGPSGTETTIIEFKPEEPPIVEIPETAQPTSPPMQDMTQFVEVTVTDTRNLAAQLGPIDPTIQVGTQNQQGNDPFGIPGATGDPKLPLGSGVEVIDNTIHKGGDLTETAEFVGGAPERFKFMQANFRYPEDAIQREIEGKVYVKFIVRKTGDIDNAEIVKKLKGCKECDAEALRVVKKMPRWNPGKIKGKPVDSYFNLPVIFQLQ